MCIEPQSSDGATQGFRSLKELTRDFEQRRIVAKRGFRSLTELSRDFQQRQITAKHGFRCLSDLIQDFQKRQAANSVTCDLGISTELPVDTKSEAAHRYDRAELLAAFYRLSFSQCAAGYHISAATGIRTVFVPCTQSKMRRTKSANPHPSLDDEKCLIKKEAGIARGSCADAKNDEMIGKCEGGWAFDDAVEANDSSTAASDGSSPEQEMVENH